MRDFIDWWNRGLGGAERANAVSYLTGLIAALDLPHPFPSEPWSGENDYAFERSVRSSVDEGGQPKRIDLYKRDCFVLEAKQSRRESEGQPQSFNPFERPHGLKSAVASSADRQHDALMRQARMQGLSYISHLPVDHTTPPFLIVCDIARGFEVWADFTGTGRGYAPFPDRTRYRFSHSDLAKPEIQALLKTIWNDPGSLDPSRKAAEVTREIFDQLAAISRRLEADGHFPQKVAQFIMRCIFTMFAADVGLLPKERLVGLFEDCIKSPRQFVPMMSDLWKCLAHRDHAERYFGAFGCHLPHVDGGLFNDREALPL